MKSFFHWDIKKTIWTLILFSILGYFLPILSPLHGATDIVQYGLPLSFFTINLMPIPDVIQVSQQVFSNVGLLADLLFSYVLGCLAVFIVQRFRESTSLVFRSIILASIFVAIFFVVYRVVLFQVLIR